MASKAPSAKTPRLPNIEELIESGGEITVGQIGPIHCAATACDESNSLAMLQRRTGESFTQLLQRLDGAIALAWNEEIYTDEINASD